MQTLSRPGPLCSRGDALAGTVDRDTARHSGMLGYGNEPACVWGTCQGSAEPEWIAQEIGFAMPREFKKNPAVNG